MATTVYLLYNFNSYHNRILKKFNTLTEYTSSCVYDLIANANFDYKDGVTSSVAYNLGTGFNYDNSPNYALVVDNDNGILSRWYVVDGVKTRGGQYVLTLLRDGIADYFDDIKTKPIYLEKGTLKLSDTPFIFNSEDIEFNQIKQDEALLKDKTGCPWIVGFMAQKQPDSTLSTPFTTTVHSNIIGQADATYNSMAEYPYYSYLSRYSYTGDPYRAYMDERVYFTIPLQIGNTSENLFITYLYTPVNGISYVAYGTNSTTGISFMNTMYRISGSWASNYAGLINTIANELISEFNVSEFAEAIKSNTFASDGGIHTEALYNAFMAEEDKIIKTNNAVGDWEANVYRISTEDGGGARIYGYISNNGYASTNYVYANTTLNNLIKGYIDEVAYYAPNVLSYTGNYSTLGYFVLGQIAYIKATQTTLSTLSCTFSDNARGLMDAPYRMFAIPYNDNIVKWKNNAIEIQSNKDVNMSIAQAITTTFSGTWLYDLQLVPYCPFVKSNILSVVNNETIIDYSGLQPDIDYTFITDTVGGTDLEGLILWCQTSQVANYQINYSIPKGSTITESKIKNQCDMYRLSSPSYNSIFEFNAEKNGGVNFFDVDFVYKPYDSYIHINPNFGMLYGYDANDARGLVFTGPFSLPQTTSAWMQYKLNNMNYQNSFDRQIDNMSVMHKIDMKELGWKIAAGTVQGAISGGAAGAAGGVVGMAAGGIIGAGMSLAGGLLDQKHAKERYSETLDYTIDQFNYSLQNIKAQGQTISKVSAFTPNNKVFPVLEYYSCTLEEKKAFEQKLKYNGMTVNYITTLGNFYNTWPTEDEDKRYTKGKLIRLNINEDNHLVEHITEELDKGVFI